MAFEKFKKLYDLQKQAKSIQRDLRNTKITSQSPDGKIKVVINGEQKIEEINISEELLSPDRKRYLENTLLNVFKDGMDKVQKIAAEKAKDVMGGLF